MWFGGSYLLLLSADNDRQLFVWLSSFVDALFFLIGCMYYVAGSYPPHECVTAVDHDAEAAREEIEEIRGRRGSPGVGNRMARSSSSNSSRNGSPGVNLQPNMSRLARLPYDSVPGSSSGLVTGSTSHRGVISGSVVTNVLHAKQLDTYGRTHERSGADRSLPGQHKDNADYGLAYNRYL